MLGIDGGLWTVPILTQQPQGGGPASDSAVGSLLQDAVGAEDGHII